MHASRRRRGEEKTRQAARLLSPPRPLVPGHGALGPSSCRRRRPEAPAEPRLPVAIRVTSPRWGFQSRPARKGEQRKFPSLGGALLFTSTILLSYLGLSGLESLPLQVLVRISLGQSLLSDGLFLLCFLLCLLCFPISACPVYSVPISFHYPTWDFLQDKVALRPSPNLILDHEELDLSPELHSPFNYPKSRVLDSYGSRLCFRSAVPRKFCNSLNQGLFRTLSHG